MSNRPNLLFILADQLRASSLPLYGESQIETPNIDRLARQGVTFDNMISTCPVCTPYRSMLLTGRHPQTTGHLINFVSTRHDEIGFGDAAVAAGYRTGWVGKWHLHRGSFPETNGRDFVPEGRDRLGFQFWRGYNFHVTYFNGWVNKDDWHGERWDGYETDAMARYSIEFLDGVGDDPFCLFVSPHQPHATPSKPAPDEYYERLPKELSLPDNVPEAAREPALAMYRHYLAMTLAFDDMVGELLDHLEATGKADNTLVVMTSDHGTQGGAHAELYPNFRPQGYPWEKMFPFEESLRVPMVFRLPGVFDGGRRCDTLTSPVDFFPSFCSLLGIPIPRTVEGVDLSAAWKGEKEAPEQEAVLTMSFTNSYDYLLDGREWRGVRTRTHSYARWLNGEKHLYDLSRDPLQMQNLAGKPEAADLEAGMESMMRSRMEKLGDTLHPCHEYADWFDYQRRIVRNAKGPLGDPEAQPDWSLLKWPLYGS